MAPTVPARVTDMSGEGATDRSPGGVTDTSPEESQYKESHLEEESDLDYPPTNRKKRDSRLDSALAAARPRQYPRLREILADYMISGQDEERVYPSDRNVVDVMDAAAGATEAEVVQCLRYLHEERGLRPGTKYGPRHFSWFKTVVADYFLQKRDREFVINPSGNAYREMESGTGLNKADFDRMTATLE